MSAQQQEALVDLLVGQTVIVQVPNVGGTTGFLRRESAERLADLLLMSQPDENAITFKLADPHDWSDDWCCVCGSEDVAGRRGLYLLTDGSLGRVAWCSDPKCLEDRARTNYLPTPERLRAALASPVREHGRSEGEYEWAVVRPALTPGMSGRPSFQQIISATFRTRVAAENALKNVPGLRGRGLLVVSRTAPGPWLPPEGTDHD